MKRIVPTAVAAILVLASTPALFAGGKECNKDAAECLSAMAAGIQKKGYLGVDTEKDDHGRYRVTHVAHYSPAQKAGFKIGDVLLAINGASLYDDDKAALKAVKSELTVGSRVSYQVERAGSKKVIEGTLAKVPEEVMAQWIGEHMLDQHAHLEVASS
jgi:C-terminal processing protease CtpA/Prc